MASACALDAELMVELDGKADRDGRDVRESDRQREGRERAASRRSQPGRGRASRQRRGRLPRLLPLAERRRDLRRGAQWMFPFASFTGSMAEPNQVFAWRSEDNYQGTTFLCTREPGELSSAGATCPRPTRPSRPDPTSPRSTRPPAGRTGAPTSRTRTSRATGSASTTSTSSPTARSSPRGRTRSRSSTQTPARSSRRGCCPRARRRRATPISSTSRSPPTAR